MLSKDKKQPLKVDFYIVKDVAVFSYHVRQCSNYNSRCKTKTWIPPIKNNSISSAADYPKK